MPQGHRARRPATRRSRRSRARTAATHGCLRARPCARRTVGSRRSARPSPQRRARAVCARRSLDEMDGWLPAAPFAHLRAPAEQQRRFARWPGAVERTVEIAELCAFDLKLAAPQLPDYPVPFEHDEMSWLRELVRRGAAVYYPQSHAQYAQAVRQIEY